MDAIVAVYSDWGIGADGTQPVILKADRQHFVELTRGRTVIVGRRTLADFPGGRPLKGRRNIVLTRQSAAIDGAEIAHYDKIHLFGMFREDRHVGAGREVVAAGTPFGKIGFAVCYDLRFPELFIRLARAGAKLAVICAAFPHPRSEHWRVLCRARAIENQFFVAAVNQCGEESLPGGTAKYCGLSAVFDPWGEIVAECPPDAESLAFADIDLSEADEIRAKMPVLSDRVLM